MKIKIITSSSQYELQRFINDFCDENNIVDIKFTEAIINNESFVTAYILHD